METSIFINQPNGEIITVSIDEINEVLFQSQSKSFNGFITFESAIKLNSFLTGHLSYRNIQSLKRIVNTLKISTRPIKVHNDPLSINDCWNELSELINKL